MFAGQGGGEVRFVGGGKVFVAGGGGDEAGLLKDFPRFLAVGEEGVVVVFNGGFEDLGESIASEGGEFFDHAVGVGREASADAVRFSG